MREAWEHGEEPSGRSLRHARTMSRGPLCRTRGQSPGALLLSWATSSERLAFDCKLLGTGTVLLTRCGAAGVEM